MGSEAMMDRTAQTEIQKLKHFFLLSRPYSYADNIARAFLVCGLYGAAGDATTLLITGTASTLMWLFLNWLSDWVQKQPGRLLPPLFLVWTPVAMTILLAAFSGPIALLALFVYVISILLYPWKSLIVRLGDWGPILRGVTIAAHYWFVITLMPPDTAAPPFVVFALACVLFFAHAARNLVGDIRDIRSDVHELPARRGFKPALRLTRVFVVGAFLAGGSCAVGALLTGGLVPGWWIWVLIPIGVQWTCLEILAFAWGRARPHHVGYVGHRLFVLTFTVMELLIAYDFGVNIGVCVSLCAFAFATNITYWYVPGKRYPTIVLIDPPLGELRPVRTQSQMLATARISDARHSIHADDECTVAETADATQGYPHVTTPRK